MLKIKFSLVLILSSSFLLGQNKSVDHKLIKEDLDLILNTISNNYVYLEDKSVDFDCLEEYYGKLVSDIKTEEETVLFFEYLLDEFYDNHLTLRTNTNASYRLFAPVYSTIKDGKSIITNVWQTQIEGLNENIIGAEILRFNGVDFQTMIADFPCHCNDKGLLETREWIANKVLCGRYDQPRNLTIKLLDGSVVDLDLDRLIIKSDKGLLSTSRLDNIGLIRINNSLGNDDLVTAFDKALDELRDSRGLIIDLRNTVFGGDSYEARGIMSRFIREPKPYQRHAFTARSEHNPDVERNWVEYVSPRLEAYDKPVLVLVGRWTGSMGEGLAIGFEGMGRGIVVGTEMRRLAGEVYDFGFKHQWYGYKLSTTRLFHMNGISREDYSPSVYVEQSTNLKDETLERALEYLQSLAR
jgi:hypothetical protein